MPRGGPRLRDSSGRLNIVGERVREKRVALGLFRDQLAARLATATEGVWNPSEDEVYKLEAGKRICSDLEIKVLARVLDCSVMWLMGEEQQKSN